MSEHESGIPKEAQKFTATDKAETPKSLPNEKESSKPVKDEKMPYGRYTYPGWQSDWQAVKMGVLGEYEMDIKEEGHQT